MNTPGPAIIAAASDISQNEQAMPAVVWPVQMPTGPYGAVAGGATITQLAEHLDVTRQAAAQLVDELSANGYVERCPHPRDARARLIVLTEKGWACTPAAEAAIRETLRPWEAAFGRISRLDLVPSGVIEGHRRCIFPGPPSPGASSP